MTAKPEVVGEITPVMARVPQSVLDATVQQMESNELEIESLKRQRAGLIEKNRLLQEQLNEAQLQASLATTKGQLAEAQLLRRVVVLEADLNNLRNWIAGHAVQRAEFEALEAKVNGVPAV